MDLPTARRRFAEARSARLATGGHSGAHIVPIVFAVVGDQIVTAIDHKPKKTRQLRRLTNIAVDPRVAVIVDHYDDDWDQLWWVRADGRATVLSPHEAKDQVDVLVAKYPQYQDRRPDGPVILIDVQRWRSWQAQDPEPE